MIHNNKVTENLKYILKQIYNDPRAKYVTNRKRSILQFDGKEIARYKADPDLWYVLGIVEAGVTRIFYADEQILEIRAIFGRKGEEAPVGEYEIKNRAFKPTWYKKEERGAPPVPGSYGIHGVNAGKVNKFYKKNFDWRNGSTGCPNIQEWYLNFLGKVLPLGAKVNIVSKDKWDRNQDVVQAASAA